MAQVPHVWTDPSQHRHLDYQCVLLHDAVGGREDYRMAMSQTSLLVWRTEVEPKLSKRQNQVLAAIEELGEACINEVAVHLETFPNSISGRFTELKEMDKIVKTDRRRMTNGHYADYYRVKHE